jgi:hypothetical protein
MVTKVSNRKVRSGAARGHDRAHRTLAADGVSRSSTAAPFAVARGHASGHGGLRVGGSCATRGLAADVALAARAAALARDRLVCGPGSGGQRGCWRRRNGRRCPCLPPQVLQAVLTQYGVPPESFARVCVIVDKLDKLPR